MNNNIHTNTNSNQSSAIFINAKEMSEQLGVSKSYAYRLIQQLNDELKKKGFLVVQGKTNRRYFYEKIYGMAS